MLFEPVSSTEICSRAQGLATGKDPGSRRRCMLAWDSRRGDTSLRSPFRKGLAAWLGGPRLAGSHRSLASPRSSSAFRLKSCPSQGSPWTMTEHGGVPRAELFLPTRDAPVGRLCSGAPDGRRDFSSHVLMTPPAQTCFLPFSSVGVSPQQPSPIPAIPSEHLLPGEPTRYVGRGHTSQSDRR